MRLQLANLEETRPTNSGLQPDTGKPEYYYY